MQSALKLFAIVGLVGLVAACSQQEEVVIVEPVEPEPVLSKF